jgi:2,4-dienoyl-CoA reductase (NADPH2)
VVGAGPAGLAASTVAAERGHAVDLFDAGDQIGGQFNMAKQVPGKEEFHQTLRYFGRRIEANGVRLHLRTRVTAETLLAGGYDEILLATGVTPRPVSIPGMDAQRKAGRVLSYVDVLAGQAQVGARVALIGAGGIGFDVAEYLVHDGHSPTLDLQAWKREWGVGDPAQVRGGVLRPQPSPPVREVFLLQRKNGKPGAGLGKTTGWIHRASLQAKGVQTRSGVNYESMDARGLLISFGEKREKPELIEVDHVVICAGQEPLRELQAPLLAAGAHVHLIGGADKAAELDAKRAIDQGSRLAARL